MKIDKNKLLRALIRIGAVIIVLGLLYVALNNILPGFIDVLADGDQQAMQEYLSNFNDLGGYAVGFLLQFIQIITIVLPSVPIQLAMGLIFGTWKGFLICYLGYVSANIVVFAVSRKLGKSLERILPSQTKSYKNNFLLDASHPAFNVFVSSIIPVIPNGVIPYVAAKTRISFHAFLAAVAVGCTPTVFTLCAIGGKITTYDFKSAILLALPLLVLVIILVWQKNNILHLYEVIMSKINKNDDETEQ